MRIHEIQVDDAALRTFCGTHGINELLLFGSITRPDFGPDSDVDVIARFGAGRKPDLWDFAGLQMKLSEMFGRPVHLHTDAMIDQVARPTILRSARVAYAA